LQKCTEEKKENKLTELDLLRKAVHDKGFNISMMINTYKKKQVDRKTTYKVPESVFCDVCKEYLKSGDNIDKSFPYFMKVLVMKAQESCANNSKKQAGANKFGKMPDNIKAIMRGM